MSIENLKEALPEYAKDLKLNLGTVARGTVLSQSQLWGTLVATRPPPETSRCSRRFARRPRAF